MSDQPDPAAEAARVRRNRLIGRLLIIAMGLLVLAQIVPVLLRVFKGGMI